MACSVCAPRYCSPNRCYCGHAECDASATYTKTTTVVPRVRHDAPASGADQ